ncbi:MAG: tetratricopeptide repeat protein [Gammaproteobacteria bacterium]
MIHKRSPIACLCTLLLAWAGASAALAQPQGEGTVTQGQSLQALSQQADRYEQQVSELNGSYDQGSAEIFRSLASVYWQMGQLEEAANAYQEALQALRVNEGLASESQLAVISEFNGLLFEQEDWEQLDTHFHLQVDMSRRLYGVSDVRYLRASNTLAGWKIRAFQTGIYQGRGDRSIQLAAEIYRTLAEQLPETDPNYHRRLAGYHSAQGLAHFYSARFAASLPLEEFRAAPQGNNVQNCVPTILSVDGGAQPSAAACQVNQGSDAEFFASQQREKSQLVRRHLGNMRQSFMLAIEALENAPDVSIREQAVAILNYGDANMLAEDYHRARTQYAMAYELLSANPQSIQLRDELMDQPRKALQDIVGELPFDSKLQDSEALGTISFDVGERGEILNISIEGMEDALIQQNLGAIAMMLEQSPYRPRIVEGRPVQSRVSISTGQL